MALTLTTPKQMRFADIDSFGHANNIAQQSYFDLGKAEFFTELWSLVPEQTQVTAMIVSVQNDFLKQILWGDDISVITQVEAVGTKSLTFVQQIVRGEELCSRSRTVMVCYDMESQQSVEVPAEWRKLI
jgi:acyl-CoA thioester hydrolase